MADQKPDGKTITVEKLFARDWIEIDGPSSGPIMVSDPNVKPIGAGSGGGQGGWHNAPSSPSRIAATAAQGKPWLEEGVVGAVDNELLDAMARAIIALNNGQPRLPTHAEIVGVLVAVFLDCLRERP